MKELVTGAAGFIGSAPVLRLLARGNTVIGIDNHNNDYDPATKVFDMRSEVQGRRKGMRALVDAGYFLVAVPKNKIDPTQWG